MRKLTFTLATAACALIVNACQDATEPDGGPSKPASGSLLTPDHPAFVAGVKAYQQAHKHTSPQALNGAGSGNDTECAGVIVGTFDNVVVPPGGFCIVDASLVLGNIKALENSVLGVLSSTVRGSIDGDKADVVQIIGNTIQGNIQIKEGGPFAGGLFEAVACGNNLPQGNIQIEKMTGTVLVSPSFGCSTTGNTLGKGNIKVEENRTTPPDVFDIRLNAVGGNLQVFKNLGSASKTVQLNTVRQNLQCKENEAPFVGTPNTAGKAEDQCKP